MIYKETGRRIDRPDPDERAGACPVCGEDMIANYTYVDERGYILTWTCWGSCGPDEEKTCNYERVLI